MAKISMLIPKNRRPVINEGVEALAIAPEQIIDVPLLGHITAGNPIDLNEASDEMVSVPSSMVRRNTYALRVKGHSMIDDNIEDGDIIVVEKRETADNGQTVVAMINGETVTLKRFYIESEGIRLQPANPDMEPIFLKHEEIQILGIVSGVIRKTR